MTLSTSCLVLQHFVTCLEGYVAWRVLAQDW